MPNSEKFRVELFLPKNRQKPRNRGSHTVGDNPAVQTIWDVIGAIPRGAASSYGAVARAAGLPGRARLTGYALKLMPSDMHLPWHRVVGATGRIAFPKGSSKHREQARLLRSEGIVVKDGRVQAAFLTDLEDL